MKNPDTPDIDNTVSAEKPYAELIVQKLFEYIILALKNNRPFIVIMGDKPVEIMDAIKLFEDQKMIDPSQAARLRETAKNATTIAAFLKSNNTPIVPAPHTEPFTSTDRQFFDDGEETAAAAKQEGFLKKHFPAITAIALATLMAAMAAVAIKAPKNQDPTTENSQAAKNQPATTNAASPRDASKPKPPEQFKLTPAPGLIKAPKPPTPKTELTTATARAPQVPEKAHSTTFPISTKPGLAGPQFDEAGSIKQWKQAGWTINLSLRPDGKKNYTLRQKDQTFRIIVPAIAAGQTSVIATPIQ